MTNRRCSRFFLSGVLVVLSGCAPALSSFTPAHVARPKHVQVEIGTDVSYPPDTLSSLYDSAKALSGVAERRELTSEEQRVVLRGAATQ
jgi:hypothetical protein